MTREQLDKLREEYSQFMNNWDNDMAAAGLEPPYPFDWFATKIAEIEREAYNEGYEDAKKHRDLNMTYEWVKDKDTSKWI